MGRSKLDDADFELLSAEFGIEASEVKAAVHSFFDCIFREAKVLPFDNFRKIYSKDKFLTYSRVHCIPSIGRIGPSYSRYKKWRANESKELGQVLRSSRKVGLTQDEIEHIAEVALSGGTPSFKKKKEYEMYERVWMVGTGGKKLARQIIPKKKKNVQD